MTVVPPAGLQQRKEVLLHLLLHPRDGLAAWCSCTWSKPVVEVWKDAIVLEMAYCLVKDFPGSRAAAKGMKEWLEAEVLPELKEDSQRLQPLIDMFTRLAKRLEEMADGTHTQLMKQLAKQRDEGTLPNSLLQLLPDTQWEGPWTHALPVALTAAGGSVFDQHYEEQVLAPTSKVRPNQRQVAAKLYQHAQAAWRGRPRQQQLGALLEEEYQAVARLRQGVLVALQATYTLVAGDLNDTWRAPLTQRLLELRSARERLEQVLTTQHTAPAAGTGPWNNPAQGAVEPPGGGKTGIINLAPLAVLPSAPADVPRRVLVVAPNTTIRNGLVGSYSTAPRANCLRDVLQLVQHPEMLPAAANLAAYSPFVAIRRPGDAPVSGAAAGDGRVAASAAKVSAAVVAAAAAMPLSYWDQDEDMEEYSEFLNNLGAAAAAMLPEEGEGEEEDSNNAWGGLPAKAAGAGPSRPAGVASPLAALAAADVVVANIQQLTWAKLEKLFPRDYFGLVVIDEGHHASAQSYAAVMEYFAGAMQLLLTATPFRGDKQELPMADLMGDGHSMKVGDRICQGLVKNVALALVPVTSVTTQKNGAVRTLQQPGEVAEAGQRRDVQSAAMNGDTEAGRDIQLALMRQATSMMERLRAVTGHNSGKDKHKVIGKVAPGDGEEGLKYMKDLWQALIDEEFGGRYKVTCTCHNMAAKKQEQAKEDLESGAADIILQVNQLGEGYDHPSLSIAVLFCIPRCIGPYWQFVGRTTRIIKDLDRYSLGNTAFIVAHPLLGAAPLWEVYKTEEREKGTVLQGRGTANKDLQLVQVEGAGWRMPHGASAAVRGAGRGLPATAAPQVFPGLQLEWFVDPAQLGSGSSSSSGSSRPAAGPSSGASASTSGSSSSSSVPPAAGGCASSGAGASAARPKAPSGGAAGAGAAPAAGSVGAGGLSRAQLEEMVTRARAAPAAELKAMVQQLRGLGLVPSDGIKLAGAGRTGEVIRAELLATLAGLV